MTQSPNNYWWNRVWFRSLLLVAAVIFAYQPAWHAGFIWDDDAYVTHNSLLTAPDGLKRIWFSLDSPSQYFPLTYTVFRLEHALWGFNPAYYHWVNILLHAANILLAWRLLGRLNVPGAWLAAALFALHPVNVESVAWVTELKNVLMLFFSLLALLAWVAFVDESGTQGPGPKVWYGLAFGFYALALFSKTTACTLPAAMLLILWLKHKPINWIRLAQVVPFVALGIGMGLVTVWWEQHHQGTEGKIFALGLRERILIASRAVWFYAGKLIWPANLTFSYPRWVINPGDPLAYAWLVAGAGLCAVIYFARRFAGRSVEVAALFYVATLSTLLGFVMLYTFHYTFVADHYQYVAMIGPIALIAAGITVGLGRFDISKPFLLKPVLCGALLLGLGVLTWRQCGMYTDLETLWRTTLVRNPQSYIARNNLGDVLLQKGQLDQAKKCFREILKIEPGSAQAHCNLGAALSQSGQPDEAIREYQKALEIQPGLAEVHKNLGDVYLQLGQVEKALVHSRKAVEIKPDFAEAQNNLGNALLQCGQVDEAIVHLQKAVDLLPEYPNALNNLGVALVQKGKFAAALVLFQKAVDLRPDFAEAHNNLGKLELQKGKVHEAVAHYQTALKLQPDDPDTLANLAWVLATWPEASIRNGTMAIELARRANELSGRQSPVILGTLAAAYAEGGRFAEAVTTAQQALQLAAAQTNTALADTLRLQLRLYQAGSPFRDSSMTEDADNPDRPKRSI